MLSPSAALVAALLTFASNVSGLPVPQDHQPKITLTAEVGGRWLGPNRPEAGLTYNGDGAIYLFADWKEDVDGYCILAHELTHYLQATNHANKSPEADERQAYRTTLACYEHYGLRRQAAWAKAQIKHPHVLR